MRKIQMGRRAWRAGLPAGAALLVLAIMAGCGQKPEETAEPARSGRDAIFERMREQMNNPTAGYPAPWEYPDTQTIAMVDEVQITLGDLREWGSVIMAREKIDPDSLQGSNWFERTAPQIMQSLVIYHTLRLRAEHGVPSPGDEEVNEELEKVRRNFPNQATFEAYLTRLGYSVSDFREILRQDLRFNRFLNHESEKFTGPRPTDEVVRRYYQENRRDLVLPKAIKYREIFLLPESVRPREDGKTTAEAASDLYQLIRQGANFDDLARQHTDRTEGYPFDSPRFVIQKELLDQDFAGALFADDAKGLLPPIATKAGVYIVEILEVRPSSYMPLDETSMEMLRLRIQAEQKQRAFAKWIEDELLKHRILVMDKVIHDPNAIPEG